MRVYWRPSLLRARSAFSLIELLIVLTIAALLLSLLMPSFRNLRESARQAVCASNMHQIGIALTLYADENRDRLPYSVFAGVDGKYQHAKPHEMIAARVGDGVRGTWDATGFLFAERAVSNPQVFYCPSHSGDHPFERYASLWRDSAPTRINTNYQYRNKIRSRSVFEWDLTLLRERHPSQLLLSDGLRTKSDFNHVVGANGLRTDMSVHWFADNRGYVYNSLPDFIDETHNWGNRNPWNRLIGIE